MALTVELGPYIRGLRVTPHDRFRPVDNRPQSRGEELARLVEAHPAPFVMLWTAELDDTLTKLSQNWRLERMAVVERNVIRIALYELKYCEGVPVNVVLNEAIELAKRYGISEGAAFTNGLLDRAVGELGIRR